MRVGRLLFFAVILVSASARPATAQLLGYATAGPAGFSGFFGSGDAGIHAAGGAEALLGGIVGVGAEYGILAGGGAPLFVLSANGVVHLLPATRRVSPFITGGYTRMSNTDGAFRAWNAGAGVDLWAKDRVGVRLEFRDHVRDDPRGTVQYWALRGGVVLR